MSEQQRVVVGVDGSADSTAALEWAEHFAGQTGAPLLLVTTWEQPVEYGVPAPWPAGYRPDKTARAVVEKARAHLGNTPVPVEITVREGRAGRVLVDIADHSAALVVGSQGHGALAEAVLGSVSAYCVRHAHCPVVVVR